MSLKNKRLFPKRISEQDVQNELHSYIGGLREVQIIGVGVIDILTEEELIEVKGSRQWKSALGQVLCYGLHYPDHKKVICLFHNWSTTHETFLRDLKMAQHYCNQFDIEVFCYKEFMTLFELVEAN